MHPNSLANLRPNLEGMKPRHGANKKKRNISVTDEAWSVAKAKLKEDYGLSVSEAVELIGRGQYKLTKVEKS